MKVMAGVEQHYSWKVLDVGDPSGQVGVVHWIRRPQTSSRTDGRPVAGPPFYHQRSSPSHSLTRVSPYEQIKPHHETTTSFCVHLGTNGPWVTLVLTWRELTEQVGEKEVGESGSALYLVVRWRLKLTGAGCVLQALENNSRDSHCLHAAL